MKKKIFCIIAIFFIIVFGLSVLGSEKYPKTAYYSTQWELIGRDNNIRSETWRLRLPRGWLVRSHNAQGGVHQIFISDPQGRWKIK